MRTSLKYFNNNQGQISEELFFSMLNDLTTLNNIGLGHTKTFVKICEEKKKKVKDQLNQLIIELRNKGTQNPELQRYL